MDRHKLLLCVAREWARAAAASPIAPFPFLPPPPPAPFLPDYPNGNALAPQPAAKDPTGGPGAALQLGYAAVCGALGAEARTRTRGCSPGEPLTTLQLDEVVASFLSFSAGVLRDAGLPRSRVAVHTGSFFGAAPPCMPHTPSFPYPCAAFNSPAAALIPEAFPGWSLYGSGTAPARDAGLPAALGAAAGAPWAAPEWNIFSGSRAQWDAAFAATLGEANNRVLVVQNYESIKSDGVACAALVAALAAGAGCLIDAPTALAAAPLNASAWGLSWALARGGGGALPDALILRASTLALTLPSGELAVADVFEAALDGGAAGATLPLPPGFSADHVFWSVAALGCAGAQRMASDAAVIALKGL